MKAKKYLSIALASMLALSSFSAIAADEKEAEDTTPAAATEEGADDAEADADAEKKDDADVDADAEKKDDADTKADAKADTKKDEDAKKEWVAVQIDHSMLFMTAGGKFHLSADVMGSKKAKDAIAWSSSDTSVATIEANGTDGLIRAKKNGSCIISISVGDVVVSCRVEVALTPVHYDWLYSSTTRAGFTVIPEVSDEKAPETATFEGTVLKITLDEKGGGSVAMLAPDSENTELGDYVFNFNADTKFTDVKVDEIKEGDALTVVHSAVATMSLPPQSPAIEISPAQK